MELNDKIRPDLKDFPPYSAHTSPDTLKEQFGLSVEEIIKLDANENPYGCPPRVVQALSKFKSYGVYPDASQLELRRRISDYIGVDPERIVIGAGSDQLIDLIIRLMIKPGDGIINLPPTFGMYSFYARLAGAKIIEIKRHANFQVNNAEIEASIEPETKLIFVANPNNPTGNLISKQGIKELLQTGLAVVVDEAYYEFSGQTVMDWIGQYDNLIVLRSFSKWAGLAGLRVGYGVFPATLADYMMRIKDPYSVNAAAQVAVIEALESKAYLLNQVRDIINERQRLFDQLRRIEGIEPYPSDANFILCDCSRHNAPLIVNELKNRGMLVRWFDAPKLRQCIRISIGRPEQNDILVESIKEILGEVKPW